jgi:alpha/beta superfamily hydrolase
MTQTEASRQIKGPVGPLELYVDAPQGGDSGVDLVICHPHPLHGGTLHNKVVHTLARAARDRGLRAVRFNFRGVGASAGSHDQGRGEVDDLLAVVDWCRTGTPERRLLLAGFSFGAWVAAAGAARLAQAGRAPARLFLVAPPVFYTGFAALPPLPQPLHVLQGESDEVVPAEEVEAWVRRCQPAAEWLLLPAGHFFHGQLPLLKSLVEARLP